MLLFLILVCFTPAPPAGTPNISGHCQFGRIEQNKRKVFVVGEHWNATGVIQENGLVYLGWSSNNSARFIHGLYKISDEGNLVGHWGYADEVELSESDICGKICNETLYRRVDP